MRVLFFGAATTTASASQGITKLCNGFVLALFDVVKGCTEKEEKTKERRSGNENAFQVCTRNLARGR